MVGSIDIESKPAVSWENSKGEIGVPEKLGKILKASTPGEFSGIIWWEGRGSDHHINPFLNGNNDLGGLSRVGKSISSFTMEVNEDK